MFSAFTVQSKATHKNNKNLYANLKVFLSNINSNILYAPLQLDILVLVAQNGGKTISQIPLAYEIDTIAIAAGYK